MEVKQLELQIKKIFQDNLFEKLNAKQKRMASTIFKYAKKTLKSHKFVASYHNKIEIDLAFLIYLSEQANFRQYSNDAYLLTKWLKKNKYISSNSLLFPRNIKFLPTTIAKSFLKIDLPLLDNILEFRDNLFNEYKHEISIGIYIYLRIYHLQKILKEDIIRLDYMQNVFKLNQNNFLFILTRKEDKQKYIPLNKYFLDPNLIKIIQNYSENSKIFQNSLDYYENEVKKYLKNKSLYYYDIRKVIEFEYAFLNRQIDLTFKTEINYPKINLLEIDHMYPSLIPEKLLSIEKHNFNVYFNTLPQIQNDIDFDDEEMDANGKANEYVTNNLEEYDLLSQCIKVPQDEKKFEKYLNEYYALIKNFKIKNPDQNNYLYKFFDFVEYLLLKADKKYKKKPIKKSTLKEYLRIIFRYCFRFIIIDGGIHQDTMRRIKASVNIYDDRITLNTNIRITTRSAKTYYRIIKLFLKKYTIYTDESKIQMAVDIRRSIVFLDEINTFIDKLIENENAFFLKLPNSRKHITFKKNMKASFIILLFYSGLRKNELRTLLTENLISISDNHFEIIVSRNNFKLASHFNNEPDLKEKSDNAIRLVRFIIENKKHLAIIKKYLAFLESQKCQFVFPAISDKGNILKKSVINEGFFSHLSKDLSSHTQRYTPLHSLRHSFATYKTLTLYNSNEFQYSFLYEIAKMMGHSEPSVTIQNYIHIDLLFIMLHMYDKKLIPDLYVDYLKDLNLT